jgi:hypothetical protein
MYLIGMNESLNLFKLVDLNLILPSFPTWSLSREWIVTPLIKKAAHAVNAATTTYSPSLDYNARI